MSEQNRQSARLSGIAAKKSGDRAEQQRQRILAAAEYCFIEQGFHPASMATICDTAGMSSGLVYRYFDNKNAIILAIIERQLQRMKTGFSVAQGSHDVIALLQGILHHWRDRGASTLSPVLFLEMVACAPRDEQIRQALERNNRAFDGLIRRWIARYAEGSGQAFTETQIQHNVFSLKCFIEGLAVRIIREPELDMSLVLASAELLVAHLRAPSRDG